jgi:EAL domain-containing protein (putative c-di-GMP-specific phosphodiesterase class I)
VSGGGCIIPDDGMTVEAVINAAEESLAVAKSYGRDNFVHYTSAYEKTDSRRQNINMAREVVFAVRENRVLAAFQPIVRTDTFKPAFYECLARIQKTDGGILPGGAFIGIAENIGFIRMIDRKIYEIAVEKLHEYPDLRLSVNVSGHTVSDPRSSEYLKHLVQNNPAVASRLIVEITETVAMQDMRDAAAFIHSLKDLGCKVALDDFGAGYTSFYNLKTFPFDMVKLDGVYIRDLIESPKNGKFIKALADLAASLGMECVAEMVSSKELGEILKDYNIQYYQGFHYGIPDINPDFNGAADLAGGGKSKLSR